jgi:fatty-acyl-CoA synthase
VVERYFGHETLATNPQGWFATGDLARIDQHGDLIITGRAKDLIKSGGEWINPAEIEAVLNALPEVAMSAVIAKPHPRWGERPIVVVELRDRAVTDEALLASLKDKVASWWIPDEIVRLEAMPVAGTGKIDKLRLRATYGAPQ